MDIKGLDYNTQREKLVMPEYGREIQKMVDLAISLPTKEERNACAQSIIQQMEGKNTQIRTSPDYEQTLWDHLFRVTNNSTSTGPSTSTRQRRFMPNPIRCHCPAKTDSSINVTTDACSPRSSNT